MRQVLELPSGGFSAAPWLAATGFAVVALAEAVLLLGTDWRPWAEATPIPTFATQTPSFSKSSLIDTPMTTPDNWRPSATTPSLLPVGQTLFDSGRGEGPYDRMTYLDYESEIFFTPSRDMDVLTIVPDVWFCNGTCHSTFTIYDKMGIILARWTTTYVGSVASTVTETFDGTEIIDGSVRLIVNTKYRIGGHVTTNKSIGIYTGGSTNQKSKANGEYLIISASRVERGPIAFIIASK